MKKVLLTLMILAALTLTACGGRAVRNRYDAFAAELAGRESLSYTAELRAEYPDRSVCFTLRYEKDAGGERVTVLAPALIEGISARVTEEGTALQYEGMILDTPPLDPYGLTPMNALPRLTEALLGLGQLLYQLFVFTGQFFVFGRQGEIVPDALRCAPDGSHKGVASAGNPDALQVCIGGD